MLTQAQREQFEQDGFLVVDNVLEDASLSAVEEAFSVKARTLPDK